MHERPTKNRGAPKRRRTVLYLSENCLFDRKSGAAMTAHARLRALAAAGYEVHALTMSLCDGAEEVDLKRLVGLDIDPARHVGERILFSASGIQHQIYNAGTSIDRQVSPDHAKRFRSSAIQAIDRISPDIVFGYQSPLLTPVRRHARDRGARCIFFLANERRRYDQTVLQDVDGYVVSSEAMASLFREELGIEAKVIWPVVDDFSTPEMFTTEWREARRLNGLIAMVNPQLIKGGLVFVQIANQAQGRLPQAQFACVESRMARAELERIANGTDHIRNIWWLGPQHDLRRLLSRAAIVLMPSLWFEGAGRVVVEAQMCGVPVLAYRRGGIPEMLNGAGVLFDPPQRLVDDWRLVPSAEEVVPWLTEIERLLDDPSAYAEASARAVEAARPFRREALDAATVAYFDSLPDRTHTERTRVRANKQHGLPIASPAGPAGRIGQTAPHVEIAADGSAIAYRDKSQRIVTLSLLENDRRADKLRCSNGFVQPHVASFVREFVTGRSPDVFADIGANHGDMSLTFIPPDGCRVVLFEPNPDLCTVVRQSIASHVRRAAYELVEAGVSDVAGRKPFNIDRKWSGTSSFDFRSPDAAFKGPGSQEYGEQDVRCVRLSDALAPYLRKDACVFLKVDVEGHEPRVMRGAAELLSKTRFTMILEFEKNHLTAAGTKPEKFFEELQKFGLLYRLTAVGGALPLRDFGALRDAHADVILSNDPETWRALDEKNPLGIRRAPMESVGL